MKRILFLVFALLSLFSAAAQTAGDGRFQWGVAIRGDIHQLYSSDLSTNLCLGYRFNRKHYLGIQTGYAFWGNEWNDSDGEDYEYHAWPIFADYVHYKPIGETKKNSFFWGVEGGVYVQNFYNGHKLIAQENGEGDKIFTRSNDSEMDVMLHLAFKLGYDFCIGKRQHLMLGLNLGIIGCGLSAGLTF